MHITSGHRLAFCPFTSAFCAILNKERKRFFMEQLVQNFFAAIEQIPLWLVYVFIFFSAVAEIFTAVYPGATVLVISGALSVGQIYSHGSWHLILPYLFGTMLASWALFEVGHYRGEWFLAHKTVQRFFKPENQLKTHRFLDRFGAPTLLFSKFIPGIGSLTILFSGLMKKPRRIIYPWICGAALLHTVLLFIAGQFLGYNLSLITRFLDAYSVIAVFLMALFVFYLLFRFVQRLSAKNSDVALPDEYAIMKETNKNTTDESSPQSTPADSETPSEET